MHNNANNKVGINPVTVRQPAPWRQGTQQLGCVVGRLAVPNATGGFQRTVQVAIVDEDGDRVAAMVVVDEALFVNALGHLFPRGELAEAHRESSLPPEPAEPLGPGRMMAAGERPPVAFKAGQTMCYLRPAEEPAAWGSWPPRAFVEAVDRIPHCMVDRDQAGRWYVSFFADDPTTLALELPGVTAQIERLAREHADTQPEAGGRHAAP